MSLSHTCGKVLSVVGDRVFCSKCLVDVDVPDTPEDNKPVKAHTKFKVGSTEGTIKHEITEENTCTCKGKTIEATLGIYCVEGNTMLVDYDYKELPIPKQVKNASS